MLGLLEQHVESLVTEIRFVELQELNVKMGLGA